VLSVPSGGRFLCVGLPATLQASRRPTPACEAETRCGVKQSRDAALTCRPFAPHCR